MPEFHFTIRGMVTAPEGSTLSDAGTGITLPSGHVLKVWECFEIMEPEGEGRDIKADALFEEFQISTDAGMTEFEEAF
jgi:hypothetical protein